jgi:hypothetical protein
MKKFIFLFVAMPIILLSCQKTPQAVFMADPAVPEVGQRVSFINNSQNSERFEWDFGDGTVSTEENPVHIFTGSGPVTIKLSAFSKHSLEDQASLSLNIKIPTLLEIEVREYFDQYAVANASILLYPSITDWDAQTNSIAEAFSDDDGIAVFSNLDPIVYYVDVFEKNHDNYTLRTEDVGFIRTSEILPHKINRFVAWVDYVSTRKGDGRLVRETVVRKLERKAANMPPHKLDNGIDGWEILYNRSVRPR